MIQFIGLMVGFYILVRMIQIVDEGKTTAVKGFATAGILITLFFLVMIFGSGAVAN